MTIMFPLKMSERAFVSSININEMFSRVNEKRIYVLHITFGINESIFSGNEQQKVYVVSEEEMCLWH